MLLETQRAVQCDSEIDRVWVVVKLQTIPCHIKFAFGISVLCSRSVNTPTAYLSGMSYKLYLFSIFRCFRLLRLDLYVVKLDVLKEY